MGNIPRMDEVFRARGYPEHQNAETCLTELPGVDMIRDFVVADSLHLLELGVMKRLLIGWKMHNFAPACPRWSATDVEEMSQLLMNINTPREINRGARSLLLFRIWKGQEFRNFLTYFGLVVIKKYMSSIYYEHFLKLVCAVRLASSEKYMRKNFKLIEMLFRDFILDFKEIYGPQFITSNMHNVLHVIEDIKRFGILPSISAYRFESCLGKIKSIIRSGPSPLPQVAKRMIERCNVLYSVPKQTNAIDISIENRGEKCTIKFAVRNFILSNVRFEDQWFLGNGRILKFINAHRIENDIFVDGVPLLSATNYFTEPLHSSLMDIYKADMAPTGGLIRILASEVQCKFMYIKDGENLNVFVPIIHTEKE